MILLEAIKRGTDDFGSGDYGASRGGRTHTGIDYCAEPGQPVCTSVAGTVTKLGYPYASDLSYRYVQITDALGNDHRFFYVQPGVEMGAWVNPGDTIGEAQDIAGKYADDSRVMKNHIHYEVKDRDGHFFDPESI